MATIYSITEQVSGLLTGEQAGARRFERGEIKNAFIQACNSLLKLQHFAQNMGVGEMTPDGLVLAEYDNVAVLSWKGKARTELPAMPYSLPLNMGIFHVGKIDDPLNGFIPFEPGQLQMIGEEPFISDCLGQIAYEPAGKYIIYNKDITAGDDETQIKKVLLRLVVKDVSMYSDFELLPIPSDMEWRAIEETYKVLTGQYPSDKKVDVVNKEREVAK